jgi:rSAM/selenodomain-associated transferase 2
MRITVIVPTLGEARTLEETLPPLVAALPSLCEVLVTDGGSCDGTPEVARRLGAQVVVGDPGRGQQLDLGARRALEQGAEILLFLHADTRLPPRALEAIEAAVTGGAVGGAFLLRFDDPRKRYRWAAGLINLRTRLTRTPLGDQGQFCTAQAYRALEGFRPWPIFEDLDFARRLRRHGRLVLIPTPVVTATRRYLRWGLVFTALRNWLLFALYFCGISPYRLARFYR